MMRFHPETPATRIVSLFALCCFFLAFSLTSPRAQEPAPGAPKEEEKKAEEMKAPETTAEEAKPPAPKATPEQIAKTTEDATTPHHPPKNLKKVGDHWTPYTPPDPESFPKGSQVYIIVKGDTLWDLASKFLNNPYLWPQIWDVNQYITDSHWIYPGDPLLIPGTPTVIAEAPPAQPAAPEQPQPQPPAPPEEEAEAAAPAAPAPPMPPPPPALVPVALESDVYCSNYIAAKFEPPALYIAEKEEGAKSILGNGDIVFLSRGAKEGVTAGQIYTIIRPEHDVWHPILKDDDLGMSVKSIGRLHVVAVQDESATAEITDACDAVAVGNYLVPFEEIPVPLSSPVAFRAEPVTLKGENNGYIVHVMDDKLSLGSGDLVNIDLGSANGIQPGDIFTIYREWAGRLEFPTGKMYIDGQQARAEEVKKEEGQAKYPPVILGQLVVLSTQEKTSTGKVLVAVREIAVGDKVELR